MSEHPAISVVMPVYNGQEYLREAVESVLSQTFADFELIVVDDGSTDSSLGILEAYEDARIKIFRMPHAGLVGALNLGIRMSSGVYVARMDADDICDIDRFAVQYRFLETHHEVDMVGSWCCDFDRSSQCVRKLLLKDIDLKWVLLEGNQFNHGTVMVRRQVLLDCGLYRSQLFPAEDYDLWLRICERSTVANLPLILYHWRKSDAQISAVKRAEMLNNTRRASALAIQRMLNGRDSLGALLDSTSRPEATFLMIQRFAEKAFWSGDWNLSARLMYAAFTRNPRYAARSLFSVTSWYAERLVPTRLASILLCSLGRQRGAEMSMLQRLR